MSDQFDRIFKFLWISRKEMTPEQTQSLVDFCQEKFELGAFLITTYKDTVTEDLIDEIPYNEYDVICIDGFPRFMVKLQEAAYSKPVLCVSGKASEYPVWHELKKMSPAEVSESMIFSNLKKNKWVIAISCALVMLSTIPLSIYSRNIEYKSIIKGNLEHKLNTDVEVDDITHLDNDIYLARCYTDKSQFNAYLYYDTSTVRIDEESILDTPVK